MYYRRDVVSLAHDLALTSELSVQAVYEWLMEVGRDIGKNPCRLEFRACPGKIVLSSDPDNFRLETFVVSHCAAHDDAAADYWHDRIMARQEAYMPD